MFFISLILNLELNNIFYKNREFILISNEYRFTLISAANNQSVQVDSAT